MSHFLEVQNISKVFNEATTKAVKALDDVSFTMQKGEVIAVVGESGSGKSTLAQVIARLVPTTQGHIVFESKDITHIKGRALFEYYGEMQMIFQSPIASFDPRIPIERSIIDGLMNRGMSKQDARQQITPILEACGLTQTMIQKYPKQLSGGQCQRAAIARALAVNPSLLICDEITSALDVTVQKNVLDLLKKEKERHNISMLFITHDIALVQDFADRIMVMKEGQIVEFGTTKQVIQHPQDAYTLKLLDAVLLQD